MFGRLTRGCPSYQFPKFECSEELEGALDDLALEALRLKVEDVEEYDWELIVVERISDDSR